MKQQLNVGAARVVITPPLGTILFGYAPGRPAEAVGDDLHVIAAALTYGETKAMILAADLCSCPVAVANQIRKEISEKTGIPFGSIIFNATHTHSGPNTGDKHNAWGDPDYGYMQGILVPKAVEAGVAAFAALRPALFGVGVTESNVAVNRRQPAIDGTILLGQCPYGIVDRAMTVLSFKDVASGEIILNIVHYGCHATASSANPEITRDWPGTMKDTLEKQTGGMTMFVCGSIGETGPACPNNDTCQSYDVALAIGHRAGLDAVTAWRSIKEWKNAPVHVTNGQVKVPYEPLPPKEKAIAEIARLGTEEELQAEDRWEKYLDINELIRWQEILAEYNSGDIKENYVFDQSIISIGNTAFVPFQFETFLEMTLRLRLYSKFTHTLSMSNTNGYITYLPSEDQMCRGGYEVWQFRYAHAYKMVDNADSYMVKDNLALLDEAFAKHDE